MGVISKGSGMRIEWCSKCWNSMRLSSLVLLGCTALMRPNILKCPPGCLQFAEMGKEKGSIYVEEARDEQLGRGFVCVYVCMCGCMREVPDLKCAHHCCVTSFC